MSAADGEVLVDYRDAVAVVTLNRPAVHNALNSVVLETLARIVRELDADPATRAIVLTGAGDRSFCAGADLDELGGLRADTAAAVLGAGQQVMAQIEASRVPVIAAVNGVALGGGFELVLACSFPILAHRASFALPESGLGLIPGYGGTQRLPRLLGRAVAAHLMLTGSRLDAERAYQLGLTPLAPVPPEDLLEVAVEVAGTIAARGPGASSAILQALRTSAAPPEHLALETSLAGIVTGSAEALEGIAAFKERRAPRFTPGHGAARHQPGTEPDTDRSEKK